MNLLEELPRMSWRRFNTLLNALPAESVLVQHLAYRKQEGPDIETPEDAWTLIKQAWGI